MSRKCAIITLKDYDNYGNKLQNYAVSSIVSSMGIKPYTIWYDTDIIEKAKTIAQMFIRPRIRKFELFNLGSIRIKRIAKRQLLKIYDYYIVGSDQVWNYNFPHSTDLHLFPSTSREKNIAFSASIGVDAVPDEMLEKYKKAFNGFKYISVREKSAKAIVEKISNRNDVQVLLDPTMMINVEQWAKKAKKPKFFNKNKKYILCYFLGDITEKQKKEIQKLADDRNCVIIDISNSEQKRCSYGPREFLFLAQKAEVILTDSFHLSVFSIIFRTPFTAYTRVSKDKDMSTRLVTLLETFNIKNRLYSDKINCTKFSPEEDEFISNVLDVEQKKAKIFLGRALDCKYEK